MNGETLSGRWLLLCLSLVAALWLVAARTAAAVQDSSEPFSPTLLTAGAPIQDEFAGSVTARLYGFNGSEGDRISLAMRGDLDSYLVLFGSSGQLLAYNDDGENGVGDAELLDFELPYDGRYLVLATSYGYVDGLMSDVAALPAPQPYEIVLTGNTLPVEDDVIALDATGIDGEAERTLTAEQPVGLFTFTAKADDAVQLSVESDDVSYPMTYLFAPDGSRIALTTPLSDPVDGIGLPQDGEYLVMVLDTFFQDLLLDNAGDYGLGDVTVRVEPA